ncbi:MAG: 4-hydroxy-tetrahydrodipicolinate reductase [Phycisphaerales bacterium]|nr:4-hydroxy-tetrahydrodipicolinate reductase [Phycisphaerales bacterium]
MDGSSTPIIVFGASGRMGSRVCALASEDRAYRLIGAIVRARSAREGQTVRDARDGAAVFTNPLKSRGLLAARGAVIIDFSSDSGAGESLALALDTGAALVIGTTALSSATIDRLRAESDKIALLITPNTSIGVAAASDAVRSLARTLGNGYDCSIVESHHNQKKDSPSGTALRLASAAREGGARLPDDQIVAIRGGDVVGEHTVRFAGAGEYIEITHRATSRDLFARGALRAAAWISDRQPGWYTMHDVLRIGA